MLIKGSLSPLKPHGIAFGPSFAAAGLTLSDAFRMMLMRTVAERALPFDPLTPNQETVEAMMAARRGELVKVGSVDHLLADLHADN